MNRFKSFFISLFRFLVIILLCFAAAFLIVWPLWKFATTNAKGYTWTVLVLIALCIIFAVVRSIRNKIRNKNEE
ncbi:MAG: hypothetical protein MJ181_03105 [Treponema sp.]|nr:hypothetical protein [Treponema sp.]